VPRGGDSLRPFGRSEPGESVPPGRALRFRSPANLRPLGHPWGELLPLHQRGSRFMQPGARSKVWSTSGPALAREQRSAIHRKPQPDVARSSAGRQISALRFVDTDTATVYRARYADRELRHLPRAHRPWQ